MTTLYPTHHHHHHHHRLLYLALHPLVSVVSVAQLGLICPIFFPFSAEVQTDDVLAISGAQTAVCRPPEENKDHKREVTKEKLNL